MRLSLHLGIAALIVLIQFTSTPSANGITSRLMNLLFGDDDSRELIRPMHTRTTRRHSWDTATTPHPLLAFANRGERKCGIFQDSEQPGRHRRVVGGYEAPRGFHPYVASIRYRALYELRWQCGGTVIHPRFILTAAHCVDDSVYPADYDVTVGIWDRAEEEGTKQRRTIKRLHLHPNYRVPSLNNDIAIIELETPLTITKHVGLACIPSKDFNYYHGRLCLIHGWGKTEASQKTTPNKQRAGVVPLIDRKTCTNSTSYSYRTMGSTAFCAGYRQGGVDSCQGDSGGPLVCQESDGAYTVAGVTSWGNGCAEKNNPGVYTRVTSYLDWIDRIVEPGKYRRMSWSSEDEDDY